MLANLLDTESKVYLWTKHHVVKHKVCWENFCSSRPAQFSLSQKETEESLPFFIHIKEESTGTQSCEVSNYQTLQIPFDSKCLVVLSLPPSLTG